MSISTAQRIRLGIFLVVGALFLGVFTVIAIGSKLSQTQKSYYSYFIGESLSGLEVGASVKFRGIEIGRVHGISYDPSDLTQVKVHYKIDSEFPVKSDMIAQTGMPGITGIKYVEINGGASDTAQILDEGATIPAKQSFMANITGQAESIAAQMELFLKRLNFIFHPDSMKVVKQILHNVEGITHTSNTFMAEVSPDIKLITQSVKQAMHKIDLIAADIKLVTTNFHTNFDAEKFMNIVEHVDSSAQAIQNLSENLDFTIMQSREDFSIALENLREALENTNELSKILLENPSLIIRGEQQKQRRIP